MARKTVAFRDLAGHVQTNLSTGGLEDRPRHQIRSVLGLLATSLVSLLLISVPVLALDRQQLPDTNVAAMFWTQHQANTLHSAVAPAYDRANWFRATCVGIFLALLWAVYKLHLRRLHQQFEMALEARVDERTRIARDLHDTLLQSFHGLLLRLQTASQLLPEQATEAKEKLDSAIEQGAEAITEGRDAVQGLRASALDCKDLAQAISTLGEELTTNSNNDRSAAFVLTVEGRQRDLHPIVRDDIYKISAEALRNAFRHAEAERIEVEIRYDNEQFRLRVRDDGKGLDPALLSGQRNKGHYGLYGMRERAALIGAKFTVWSEVGAGTEVELRVPSSIAFAIGRKPPRLVGNAAGMARA